MAFIGWQHHLEQHANAFELESRTPSAENVGRLGRLSKLPPPLMKLSLWSRAHGKFAVMQLIAFLEWSAFQSWAFWAQVSDSLSFPVTFACPPRCFASFNYKRLCGQ